MTKKSIQKIYTENYFDFLSKGAETGLYGTTKHGLSYFMKGLAREWAGTGVIV